MVPPAVNDASLEDLSKFVDYDTKANYDASINEVLNDQTDNFVITFGKAEAEIAFDVNVPALKKLLDGTSKQAKHPVRWINVWAPNKQRDIIDCIGNHYGFSPRLLGIMKSPPPDVKSNHKDHRTTYKEKIFEKDDIETGRASIHIARAQTAIFTNPEATSHYTIARQMVNYQSIDVGAHFTCIGANWMHDVCPPPTKAERVQTNEYIPEIAQRRLWSWLILCDDNTVISLHEDTGPIENKDDLKSIRENTLSVLRQLSLQAHDGGNPLNLQSVRQVLEADEEGPGNNGASNLFYYLFDDWRAVYATAAYFKRSLHDLEVSIFEDMTRKSNKSPDIKIIPHLHYLNKAIRQMDHLYKGYHNLITRILEPPKNYGNADSSTTSGRGGVQLATSACQRFERLGDRLQLLILSQTEELLAEKEGLSSTYFNITSQKDSEATARLNRSAALLAKLSVLFLPVSLMTSYFSTQLDGIDGKYTFEDYWIGFAAVVSASFVCLFFFGKMLMWITETLDQGTKGLGKKMRHWVVSCWRRLEGRKGKVKQDLDGE